MRNPQRFGWDPRNGTMYIADIGQNIVEEVSRVTLRSEPWLERWEGASPIGRGGVGNATRAATTS